MYSSSGKEALLVDELQALQVEEVDFQVLPHAGDHLQDAEGEVPPDDGGELHGPLQVLLQSIHAGRDDPLDGVGDLDVGGLLVENETMILLLDGAVLQEGMGQFLQEERVARRSVQDELAKFGGHLPSFEDRLHELGTLGEGS